MTFGTKLCLIGIGNTACILAYLLNLLLGSGMKSGL